MLADFIKNKHAASKNDEKARFFITYLIISQDKQGIRVSLVNEDDLEQFEKSNSVISKQIYSIENKIIEVKENYGYLKNLKFEFIQFLSSKDFNLIYSSDIDASNNVSRSEKFAIFF